MSHILYQGIKIMKRLLFIALATVSYQTAYSACAAQQSTVLQVMPSTKAKAPYREKDPLLPPCLPGELHELIRAYCREYIDYPQVAYQLVDTSCLKLDADDLKNRLRQSPNFSDFCSHNEPIYKCERQYHNGIILRDVNGNITLKNHPKNKQINLFDDCFIMPDAVCSGPHDTIIMGFIKPNIIQIRNNRLMILTELTIQDPYQDLRQITALDDGSIIIKTSSVHNKRTETFYAWRPNIDCLDNMSFQQLHDLQQLLQYLQKHPMLKNDPCHNSLPTLHPKYLEKYRALSKELQDKIRNWFNFKNVIAENIPVPQRSELSSEASSCNCCCIQ